MTDYSGAKNETVIAIVGTDPNSRGVRDIALTGMNWKQVMLSGLVRRRLR